MRNFNSKKLSLENGSKIGIVGGGPSGSFFAYFVLGFARKLGIDISVDIFEAKNFNVLGPVGCNHCGGLVSESLIQMLAKEGIVLPPQVVRRSIESYVFHLEAGSTLINAPHKKQRIASMFRGLGPKGATDIEQHGFDNYLLELCTQRGARLVNERVTDLQQVQDGIMIRTQNKIEGRYDLVVGAVGLNQRAFHLFDKLCPEYVKPKITKTYICEYYLGKEAVDSYFGNSMHVFLLNIPHIKFGAIIPKGEFATLVLLGSDLNKQIVDSFLFTQTVKKCFPPDLDMGKNNFCHCFPTINVKSAKYGYNDRVVLIGDSFTTKLYKNGIGAAYLTAKAAAETAIFKGISRHHFKKYYQPVCKDLSNDNRIGKLIFFVTGLIQKSTLIKSALLKLVIREQKKQTKDRLLSSMLWNTFTGSAPYKGIIKSSFHPRLILLLIWFSIKELIVKIKNRRRDN